VFRVSKSSGAAKAKRIEELLRIRVIDPRRTLPSRLEDHSTAWMVEFNGLIVDARRLPRKLSKSPIARGSYVP
jgi:hypothetical protein